MRTVYLSRVIIAVVVLLFSVSSVNIAYAQFAGGNGTIMDPYLIATAENLHNIRNHLTSHFRQVEDIDLSPEALEDQEWYDQVNGWLPIGTTGDNGFRGSYDGNGRVITSLTIDRRATDNAGLFGYTLGARLSNIGLLNADVHGRSWIGSLVGRLDGGLVTHSYHEGGIVKGHSRIGGLIGLGFNSTEVHFCYSTADAVGDENYVASLAGFFSVGCYMTNSYATGSAYGLSRVGGLIGKAYLVMAPSVGRVENCYSTGWVSGPVDPLGFIGGLMGRTVVAGYVFNSYWNTETSGWTTGGGLIPQELGKTTAQMLQQNTYVGWDFEEVWNISERAYPYLRWQGNTPRSFNYPNPYALTAAADDGVVSLTWTAAPAGNPQSYNIYRNGSIVGSVNHPTVTFNDETVSNYITYQFYVTAVFGEDAESGPSNKVAAMPYYFAGGTGTADDPYLIDEVSQLNGVRYLLSSHFRQTANLDLGEIPNWLPIGSNDNRFIGSYDGGGFTISNMTVSRRATSYVGLFGYAQGVTIKDINLENIHITANQYVGGIAGYLQGSQLSGCSGTGSVNSIYSTSYLSYTGGLVGYQHSSNISNGFFSGTVSGFDYVGGLTGFKSAATANINNCFSSGEVKGRNQVGGLLGRNDVNEVANSYSTANVEAATYGGGLIGYFAGSLTNCYSTGRVFGTGGNVGGLLGFQTGAVITNSYWNTQTSGWETSFGGTPKNTTEMLSTATYVNWNFETIWAMVANATYPYLRWQETAAPHNIPCPVNLTALPGDEMVTLNWSAPFVLVPERYSIYRNGVYVNFTEHPTTHFVDAQVNNFTAYSYYITALYEDEVESGPSNVRTAIPFNFGGGDGSADDPYQVASAHQLNHIRYLLSSHFIQTGDIDLDIAPYNAGQGWVPIGTEAVGSRFTGTYDGNGFAINNLYLDRFRMQHYQGLFGYVQDATLRRMALRDAYVRGDNYVGGLAAFVQNSLIDKCYITGEVEGSSFTGGLIEYITGSTVSNSFSSARVRGGHYTGGLINRTATNSVVINCYATGYIYGAGNQIGGLIGNNGTNCTVDDSYSTGQVWGLGQFGGLMGTNTGIVRNSYWNVETSAQPFSAAGEGKTTVQMVLRETYQPGENPENHWDFEDAWSIDEGASYPWLRFQGESWIYNQPTLVPPANLVGVPSNNQVNLYWEAPVLGNPTNYNIYRGGVQIATVPPIATEFEQAGLENYRSYNYTVTAVYGELESSPSNEAIVVPFPGFAGGRGTEQDPFLIADARQLNDIRLGRYRSLVFRQTAHIDIANYENWQPLGTTAAEEQFTGTYDGDGYTISNLTIAGAENYQGLFGYLSGAVIKNVGLVDVDITSGTYTGGLAGWATNSTITNCYVTGEISTTGSNTGGLLGYASGANLISDCYAIVDISSTQAYVAGLVAWVLGTTRIVNCHTKGDLSSTANYVGGLVAYYYDNATIEHCYSYANVETPQSYAGGLVAYSNRVISNSYAMGAVTGARYIGGLVGHQSAGSITNSFSTGRVSSENVADIGGFVGANTGAVEGCYWDVERSAMEASPAGTGRLTRQMTYPYDFDNVFIDWNFDEVWVADDTYEEEFNPGVNLGYPYLHWQEMPMLDTPEVRFTFNAEGEPVLSWEEIEGANSYKIFVSLDPYLDIRHWTLIEVIRETEYIDTNELGTMRFYRVVASSDIIDGRRRSYDPPIIPGQQSESRQRRNTLNRARQ